MIVYYQICASAALKTVKSGEMVLNTGSAGTGRPQNHRRSLFVLYTLYKIPKYVEVGDPDFKTTGGDSIALRRRSPFVWICVDTRSVPIYVAGFCPVLCPNTFFGFMSRFSVFYQSVSTNHTGLNLLYHLDISTEQPRRFYFHHLLIIMNH